MREKERWKKLLAIEEDVSYEAHLKETQRLVREARPVFVRQCPLSFGKLMVKQIKFLAWKIWFLQGMVLALLCAVFVSRHGTYVLSGNLSGGEAGILPVEGTERFFARFLCGCGGIIAACALPILQRSMRYKMFEVERSTRFSVRGGLAAQLLFIGTGDIGMLAALGFLVMRYGADGRVVFLFGVIPFLTAAVSGLMLWTRKEHCASAMLPLLLCEASVWAAYEGVGAVSRLLPDGVMQLGVLYALLCIGAIGWAYRQLFRPERTFIA